MRKDGVTPANTNDSAISELSQLLPYNKVASLKAVERYCSEMCETCNVIAQNKVFPRANKKDLQTWAQRLQKQIIGFARYLQNFRLQI